MGPLTLDHVLQSIDLIYQAVSRTWPLVEDFWVEHIVFICDIKARLNNFGWKGSLILAIFFGAEDSPVAFWYYIVVGLNVVHGIVVTPSIW